MSISLSTLAEFQRLFSGNVNAHGVHVYKYVKNGKEKGTNYTKPDPVTEALYVDHLNGKVGLGIIPIFANKCKFAVLDIDIYKKDLSYIINSIYNYNFPLVPFRTKSGGLHLFLFFNKPVNASKVIKYMNNIKILLGLDNKTEIFPKQSKITKGKIGNWINLPYYNYVETKQYLINYDGRPVLLDNAILEINKKVTTEEDLFDFIENIPLNDAPPCLQSLFLRGVTDYRNNFLFSLAGYFKAKFGNDFEVKTIEANNNLDKPLPIDEVSSTIISTHNKKDYSYKCNEEPINSLCNKELCKERRYGIGGEEISQLSFDEFRQYTTDPPYYEWIINSKSLKFYSESDIIQQHKFRVLCLRILHILPYKLKEVTWTKIINRALVNIIIKRVDVEDDISPGTMFKEHLTEFLERRTRAKTKEQILIDRVYKDDDKQGYIFKPKNLLEFLITQKQFRFYGFTQIQAKLREMGGAPKKYYINSKVGSIRVWLLPYNGLKTFLKEEIKIDDFNIDFKNDYKDEPY